MNARSSRIDRGSNIKVWASCHGHMTLLATGSVEVIGDGKVVINNHHGNQEFLLNSVCLERNDDTGDNEYRFGNNLKHPYATRKASKKTPHSHFLPSNKWDSSRVAVA